MHAYFSVLRATEKCAPSFICRRKYKKRNAVAFILYQFKLAHWASLAVAYFGWAVTQQTIR
jgi:hypothetical protein